MASFKQFGGAVLSSVIAVGVMAQPALAQKIQTEMPEDILPKAPAPKPPVVPMQSPVQVPGGDAAGTASEPVVQPVPVIEPVMSWSLADAKDLLSTIEFIGKEGLVPADYQPTALKAAIAKGEGDNLDTLASRVFGWLIEDLRDGRTPMDQRVQWFAVDPDPDQMPTSQLMAQALSEHDVRGIVDKMAPP